MWIQRVGTDLNAASDLLRQRRYGVIEMVDGRLSCIWLRPWPKLIWPWEALGWGDWYHASVGGNRCWCYYNQPLRHGNYLALKYILSARGATLATFHGALEVLDEIARIKRSDALLCDVQNTRISARLLARWGWEPHCQQRWHRHYIKRFYGQYPASRLTDRCTVSNGPPSWAGPCPIPSLAATGPVNSLADCP